MTTNIAGSTARQDPRNVSNTIRWRFTFADPGLAVGVQIGVLPQNAFITMQLLEIVTAFNAATTNPLSAGTVAAAYNNLFTSTDSGSTGATIAVQMTQIGVAFDTAVASTQTVPEGTFSLPAGLLMVTLSASAAPAVRSVTAAIAAIREIRLDIWYFLLCRSMWLRHVGHGSKSNARNSGSVADD